MRFRRTWWRDITNGAGVLLNALANAAVSLVLVIGLAMPRTITLLIAWWWDCAVFTSPGIIGSCALAVTDAAVCFVQIFCGSMPTAVLHSTASWRNRASWPTPAVLACAITAICLVQVCCGAMIVAVARLARRRHVACLARPAT